MNKSIDLKSLVIGGVLVSVVMCILGATPQVPVPGPIGRFAIVASHVSDNDVYVLDTSTGQVWPRYQSGGTGAFYAPKVKPQTPEEPSEPRVP